MKHIRLAVALAALSLFPACAATLTLPNSGALYGMPGQTVGWGFTLTSDPITTQQGTFTPWLIVTNVDFVPMLGDTPVGVFTPYMTEWPNSSAVIGPDEGRDEGNPWTQSFNPILRKGVGQVVINDFQQPGDSVKGWITVLVDVFSVSPNNPAFNPITDTVEVGLQLEAKAGIRVIEPDDAPTIPHPTPEPATLSLTAVPVLAIAAWSRFRRRPSASGRP